MKWVFYVIVFIYLCFRAVYGGKPIPNSVTVEKIDYGANGFWKAGTHQSVYCKASNKNQKVEWYDIWNNVVKRVPANRVFAQEHFIQTPRYGRSPALLLTFKNVIPRDTGLYECSSGDVKEEVSVCVIDPLVFVDTPAEVTTEVGRSITLSCQAKGDPEPRIFWKRNDEYIGDESDDSKYKVMTKYNSEGFEGLLTITSLEPSDSGLYYCVGVQDHARVTNCTHSETMNLTLHVNHEPVFENGNGTESVYGLDGQSIELVCAASGYPTVTYRWFNALSPDTLKELDKVKAITNEDNQSVLKVTAGPDVFGQLFKCQVSNALGTATKLFRILQIDEPQEPSEVKFYKSTDNQIDLDVSWTGSIEFPIDGFQVQYLKTEQLRNHDAVPREADWKKSKRVDVKINEANGDDPEISGMLASITDLDEETKYWIRLRVVNDAGTSPWFVPVLASTLSKSEDVTEGTTTTTETPVAEEETVKAGLTSDGTFYGIFFAGGIIIVAVVCMFAMRVV